MGIVNQAVEDGIGDGRIANLFMPVIHRQLAGDIHCFPCTPFIHLGLERRDNYLKLKFLSLSRCVPYCP